jgi:nucleotide-binding universal stress UspA family protein
VITLKRILCPTDFSDISLKALPYAVELARFFNAEIFIVYAVPPLPRISDDQGSYAEVCKKYLERLRTDAHKQFDKILLEMNVVQSWMF